MRDLARRLVEKHAGRVPPIGEHLRQLPGVRRYISNAIPTFSFRRSVPFVDGSVQRLLRRYFEPSGGKSQEHFAEECGLHRTYIGGVERGERNISLVDIERVAHAHGLSIRELSEEEFPRGKATRSAR